MAKQDDPAAYQFKCTNCHSAPNEACTEPTDTGRKKVRYIHTARTDLLDA